MTTDDLAEVDAIAARVHPSFPEDRSVFAERLHLYPDGCRVLVTAADVIAGYVISHPWHFDEPPALNVLLGRIPVPATTYYIHDLALLPEVRGKRAGASILADLDRHARQVGLSSVALIAVSGSTRFWHNQGFELAAALGIHRKLMSYGEDAKLMRRSCVV